MDEIDNISFFNSLADNNNYVRRIIRENYQKLGEIYIQKHNAFFNWRVGKHEGEEIRRLVIAEFGNIREKKMIDSNDAEDHLYLSLLTDAILQENAVLHDDEINNPESFSQQTWYNIRNIYLKNLDNQKEIINFIPPPLDPPGQKSGEDDSPSRPEISDKTDIKPLFDKNIKYLDEFIGLLAEQFENLLLLKIGNTSKVRVFCEDADKLSFCLLIIDISHSGSALFQTMTKIKNEVDQHLGLKNVNCHSEVCEVIVERNTFYKLVARFSLKAKQKSEDLYFVESHNVMLNL